MLFFVRSASTFSAVKFLLLCLTEPLPIITLIVLLNKHHLSFLCWCYFCERQRTLAFVTLPKVTQKHFCQQCQQKCRQSATVCALAEGCSATAEVCFTYGITHRKRQIFFDKNLLFAMVENGQFSRSLLSAIRHFRSLIACTGMCHIPVNIS